MQTYRAPGVTPKPKGPVVFLDYDQEELDDWYTQPLMGAQSGRTGQAERAEKRTSDRSSRSGRVVSRTDRLRPRNSTCTSRRPPTHPSMSSFMAEPGEPVARHQRPINQRCSFNAGAHFVALDFNNVIETKGDLMVMADQVRRGVAWVYRNAKSFGGDRNEVYVSGHSSGGALGGCRPHHRVAEDSLALPMDTVKGALFASGMYELRPVSLSARNSYVNFTPQVLEALSPPAPSRCSHRASRRRAWHAENAGVPEAEQGVCCGGESGRATMRDLIVLNGYNHFEVAESLGNPYGLLGRLRSCGR